MKEQIANLYELQIPLDRYHHDNTASVLLLVLLSEEHTLKNLHIENCCGHTKLTTVKSQTHNLLLPPNSSQPTTQFFKNQSHNSSKENTQFFKKESTL
jgi:hypothetical protein